MNRRLTLLLTLAVLAAGVTPALGDTTSQSLQRVAEKTKNSMVMMRLTLTTPMGDRNLSGPAICINSEKRQFMTLSLNSDLRPEEISKCEIVLPGVEHQTIKASLMGIDASTSIGFLQAESGTFQAIEFAPSSDISLGMQVFSAGLLLSDAAMPQYLGTAYVASKLRVPEVLYMVTGGVLTGTGSPVFNDKGQAIGLVARQLFLSFVTTNRRGTARVPLRSESVTRFFLPVEEFQHVFSRIPTGGKVERLPWIGINMFNPVEPEVAKVAGINTPAVKVDRVIPGDPAQVAGLRSGDYIVKLNGKPLEKLATPALVSRNFYRTFARIPIGQQISLTVIRGGKEMPFRLKTIAMPPTPREAPRYVNQQIGLRVREKVGLDRYLSDDPTAKVDGLLVELIDPSGASASGDLKVGDVITHVSGVPVKDISKFKQLVERDLKSASRMTVFTVRRGEGKLEIKVKPVSR